jgi:hypothetical protein
MWGKLGKERRRSEIEGEDIHDSLHEAAKVRERVVWYNSNSCQRGKDTAREKQTARPDSRIEPGRYISARAVLPLCAQLSQRVHKSSKNCV